MQAARSLMGGETEYALVMNPGGPTVPQGPLLEEFLHHVHRCPGIRAGSGRGRYLTNGGLLYLDNGLHMEWSTPECTSPFDVVRYLRAGDRLMERLTDAFHAATSWPLVCLRCNVDYLARTAWAAHESMFHRRPPDGLGAQLLPFLVSRIVYTGAGGWDAFDGELTFLLSPRVPFISETLGPDSQGARPIFHTKNEPLSSTGSSRLHVASGETTCSDRATLLRFGATALVLAAIDAGETPADVVALRSPLGALGRFAEDPHCRRRVRLARGPRCTAVDIQRHYLGVVERRLGTGVMPAWAEAVWRLWARTLDDLDAGSAALAVSLDWAIKRRVFGHVLEQRGLSWEKVPALCRVRRRLRRRLSGRWHWRPLAGADLEAAIRCPPLVDRVALRPLMRHLGLCWTELDALLDLRPRLLEADMRFGQLGGAGIFDALDRAGCLAHRVPGIDRVDEALDQPPEGTRAAVRGRVARRFAAAQTPGRADWLHVEDHASKRRLDLGDPFETEERWSGPASPGPGTAR